MPFTKDQIEDDYKELLTPKKLTSIVEIIDTLYTKGETIRIIGAERSKKDVLVRISDDDHQYTMTSLESYKDDVDTFFQKYWTVSDITLNTLKKFDVFLDKTFIKYYTDIRVGDKVIYNRADTGEIDVALVTAIYQSLVKESDYLFELSGDEYLYQSEEVKLQK